MSILEQNLVSFAVEGTEIPVSLSSFKSLSIVENVSQKLPTLSFIYSDPANHLIQNPLVDGAKISVVLHSNVPSDPEQPIQFDFRAMGAEYTPAGNRFTVRCSGIFDKMQYMRKIQKMPIQGTSNEAIKKAASEVGFGKFSMPDSGSDKMWWRPKNQMHYASDFINTIAMHGYSGKKSIMSLGVSDDGTMHYKDIAKLAEGNASRIVTEYDRVNMANGDVPLLAWTVKSMGGATNMLTGYGSEVKQETLTGSAETISDIVMPLFGGSLNMSSSLKDMVGEVSKVFVPTNLGNHHDKYYQAKEQNVRGQQQLQSTKIEFMTNQATGLKIYDVITFKPHNPITNKPLEIFTGNYIITSKTRYFKGAEVYREKFSLCSSGGFNAKGQIGYKA